MEDNTIKDARNLFWIKKEINKGIEAVYLKM